jgi:hypothetical protein
MKPTSSCGNRGATAGWRGTLAMGCFVLLTHVGCHGGGGTPAGGLPDGGVDAPIDAPIDAMPDGPIDAMPDGPPSTAPHPTSITNGDGGHEVRQTSTTTIVLTGTNLADVTSVTVGTDVATIDSATATGLRATFYTHAGATPGPVALTLVSPGGTTVTPAALITTPYVVAPGAPNSRGTYESPTNLCDSDTFGLFQGPQVGDTLEVLGGVHRCGQQVTINGGVKIQGAADGSSIVQGVGSDGFGFFITSDGTPRSSELRRLTFEAPLAELSIRFVDEDLLLEDIVDAGGLRAIDAGEVTIRNYVFDGPGPAIDLGAGRITLRDVTVHCSDGTSVGIALKPRVAPFPIGVGTAERVRVEHCGTGLVLGQLPIDDRSQPELDLTDVELIDNAMGISLIAGSTILRDVDIRGDATTPQPSRVGIGIPNGHLTLLGGTIHPHSITGVDLSTSGSGDFEPVATVAMDGTQILGSPVGVTMSGYDDGTTLTMRRSIVRDQTTASLLLDRSYDSPIDLGYPGNPGDNALSVVSGYALDDQRIDTLPTFRFIQAFGTTLNGHSYVGQTIEGPAALAPDYRVQYEAGAIQF